MLGMKTSVYFGIRRPSLLLDQCTGLFPEFVISPSHKTSLLDQSKATCLLSTEAATSVLF